MNIADLTGHVDALAYFVTSPFFVWLWCTLVVIYTFKWLVKLKWESVKIKGHLIEAINVVSSYKDYENFAKNFNEINSRIAVLDKLRRPWKEFCQTLIKPGKLEEEQASSASAWEYKPIVLRAAREPSEFFNDTSVIQPSIDLQFYSAIPTHLTGMGILGTFCGLAAGIFLAKSGLSGGLVDELQHALGQLLGGASLAFWTSIIGVLSSVTFSKIEKASIKHLRNHIETLNFYLSSKVQFISSEQIADTQLEQNILQTANLTQLVAEVKELRQQGQFFTEQALINVAKEFRNVLTQAAGTEIKNIALAFKNIHEAILGTQKIFTLTGEQIEQASAKACHQFASQIEKSAEHFQKQTMQTSDHLAQTIHSLTDSMLSSIKEASVFTAKLLEEPSRSFLEQVKALNQKNAEAINYWTDTIEKNQRHISEMIETQKNLTAIVEPITKTTQSMNSLYRNAQDMFIRSNQSSQNIAEAVVKLERINSQLKTLWEGYCTRFEKVDHHLKNVIAQTHSSLENYSERVKDFTSDLDKHMSKGILTLAGAVGDLHQVVGHLPDAIKEAR